MGEKMKAAVLHQPLDARIEEVEKPAPRDDEVLINVKAIGVCGSDVHYYKSGRIGSYVVEKPLILGHECAGDVVAVGPEITSLKVGDRVAVEPGVPCRKCEHCKTGAYNLCADVVFLATPPIDGAFAEYITSPADFAFKMPEGMSYAEGAMIEPLAVGMHSCNRGGVEVGQSVAVLGAGPIGLVTMQAALVRGASPVIATDVDADRLKTARELGAHHTVDASECDVVEAIMEFTEGRGVDVALETAGVAATTQQCIYVIRRGGTIVWVGMAAQDEISINVIEAICREANIKTIFRYAHVYPPSIKMVAEGKIDVRSLITHEYTLDQVPEALEFCAHPAEKRIKVMISN